MTNSDVPAMSSGGLSNLRLPEDSSRLHNEKNLQNTMTHPFHDVSTHYTLIDMNTPPRSSLQLCIGAATSSRKGAARNGILGLWHNFDALIKLLSD
ncbi:hypothetical protein QCA50_015046 [Cerrena zonata]|uniref:Uncharacterized protein n=1 Tax=Cerrena zonata TaxID=2478898 RepID=A0AAW0FTX4_9APHY